MMFIVEGRRFNDRLHAITFARQCAQESGRSIDAKVEVRDENNHVRRSWAFRMHPPGVLRHILSKPAYEPQLRIVEG